MDKKRTTEFLELMKNFQFTDLLAFASILEVKEKEDFEEFVVDILEAFNQKSRVIRREILKLAKDVSQANKDLEKSKGLEKNL